MLSRRHPDVDRILKRRLHFGISATATATATATPTATATTTPIPIPIPTPTHTTTATATAHVSTPTPTTPTSTIFGKIEVAGGGLKGCVGVFLQAASESQGAGQEIALVGEKG